MTERLESLGFSAHFKSQYEQLDARLVPGRIVAMHRREWDVFTDSGAIRAVLAGKRWADARPSDHHIVQPTIGDWVGLSEPGDGTYWVIEHVFERRTHLERGAAGRRTTPQTIVANVDWVAVVSAFERPGAQDAVAHRSLNPRRLERYLAAVAQGGAEPLLVVNKADLEPEHDTRVRELTERFAPVVVITASTKRPDGLDALRSRCVPGTTVGFVGLSGVGKSSIINALLGKDVQKTARERGSDARGRHTTTHRELFVMPEGALLIDTPGMREFALAADAEGELGGFDDVQALSEECRFRDCQHDGEPGCAVEEAVRAGTLAPDRLMSFRELRTELDARRKLQQRKRRGQLRGKFKSKRAR